MISPGHLTLQDLKETLFSHVKQGGNISRQENTGNGVGGDFIPLPQTPFMGYMTQLNGTGVIVLVPSHIAI